MGDLVRVPALADTAVEELDVLVAHALRAARLDTDDLAGAVLHLRGWEGEHLFVRLQLGDAHKDLAGGEDAQVVGLFRSRQVHLVLEDVPRGVDHVERSLDPLPRVLLDRIRFTRDVDPLAVAVDARGVEHAEVNAVVAGKRRAAHDVIQVRGWGGQRGARGGAT